MKKLSSLTLVLALAASLMTPGLLSAQDTTNLPSLGEIIKIDPALDALIKNIPLVVTCCFLTSPATWSFVGMRVKVQKLFSNHPATPDLASMAANLDATDYCSIPRDAWYPVSTVTGDFR